MYQLRIGVPFAVIEEPPTAGRQPAPPPRPSPCRERRSCAGPTWTISGSPSAPPRTRPHLDERSRRRCRDHPPGRGPEHSPCLTQSSFPIGKSRAVEPVLRSPRCGPHLGQNPTAGTHRCGEGRGGVQAPCGQWSRQAASAAMPRNSRGRDAQRFPGPHRDDQPPPRARSTRTTSTGLSSHTLLRLCSSRLARVQTQATKTTRAGGQTHPERIHHGVRGQEHQRAGQPHEGPSRRHGPALWLVGEPSRTGLPSAPTRGRSRSAPWRWRTSSSTVPTGRNGLRTSDVGAFGMGELTQLSHGRARSQLVN